MKIGDGPTTHRMNDAALVLREYAEQGKAGPPAGAASAASRSLNFMPFGSCAYQNARSKNKFNGDGRLRT
jgi:hypothetical protein